MATIARLPGDLKVVIYHNDHGPPHFHVRHAGMDVAIRIADQVVLYGSIRPADLVLIQSWARTHRDALARNRSLARAGLPLEDILPP